MKATLTLLAVCALLAVPRVARAQSAEVKKYLNAAVTLYEFYGLTAKMGAKPFRWMGLLFSVLMTAGPYYLSYFLSLKMQHN